MSMDDKDREILSLLMEDGRRSVVDIAKEVDVPRATVQERIHRMLESGIIRKFTAVQDYSKTGLAVTATFWSPSPTTRVFLRRHWLRK